MTEKKKNEENLEKEIEKNRGYWEVQPDPQDPRSLPENVIEFPIVKETNGKYKKDYPLVGKEQIEANNAHAKLIKEVNDSRKQIYSEIEKENKSWDKAFKKYQQREGTPIKISDVSNLHPSKATETLVKLEAVNAGYDPKKTRKETHENYLSETAKVDVPTWKDKIKNTFRKGYESTANVIDFSKYKQKKVNIGTYNSLEKGDNVVLYFGDKGHDSRRDLVEKSGKKYLSVFDDGIHGNGPKYSPNMSEEDKAKAVYEWAQQIHERTGQKPIIAGYNKDGEAIQRSLNEKNLYDDPNQNYNADLSTFTQPHLVATKSHPDGAPGAVRIVATGEKKRKQFYDSRNQNYQVTNATSPELGGNKGAYILPQVVGMEEENKHYKKKRTA